MSAKKPKVATPTELLLEEMKRVDLRPIDVLNRAIILAEMDNNYKEMINAVSVILPYTAPRLKETQINAEVETTATGMNGVNLNITVGGVPIQGAAVDIDVDNDNEEEEE